MQCALCGNVKKTYYKNLEPITVLVFQCRSCKLLVCSECAERGEHPDQKVREKMVEIGVQVNPRFCPECRGIQLDPL